MSVTIFHRIFGVQAYDKSARARIQSPGTAGELWFLNVVGVPWSQLVRPAGEAGLLH